MIFCRSIQPTRNPQNHCKLSLQFANKQQHAHMDPLHGGFSLVLICALLLPAPGGVLGSTFTLVNRCNHTVWPAILTNSGSSILSSAGFELPKGTSRSFKATGQWSGRIWGRTVCNFNQSGYGSCLTGDCGSGRIECNGAGAAQTATLVEFSLGGFNRMDFYDISLVDGYNLPIKVEAEGGSGPCESTGCISDLNEVCPEELRVGEDDGKGCMGPCQALGRAEYCCTGAYNSPGTCGPNAYSKIFKAACPRSYGFAFDDDSSTFTCTGADYTVTFCPSSNFSF